MDEQDDYKSLEDEFDQRLTGLGDLFDSKQSDDDERFQYPILDSLTDEPFQYVDSQQISEGGEKRIFTVKDLRTDRTVVMAKPLNGKTTREKERFLREARITACLQHPNVLTAYDVGVDPDGEPYFTMEFVKGDTLRDIVVSLREGDPERIQAYPLSRLLDLFIKVCDGLAYAHSRGVLHLDVKPHNIYIGPFGEALLCDWGIARVMPLVSSDANAGTIDAESFPNVDFLNDVNMHGFVNGTPSFMAPEQGYYTSDISTRTDIYSLGAVLYFILTNRAPVSGEDTEAILNATAEGEVTPPSEIPGGKSIPYGLEAVAMKALSVNPEDRYQTVAEFREEIERYRTGFATEAQEAGVLTLLRLFYQRKRTAIIVGFVAAVLLVILNFAHMSRLADEREAAVAAKHRAEENARLYRDETAYSRMLSDDIRATAMEVINTDDFSNAAAKAKALQSHLSRETDPENIEVLREYLAVLYFVQQNFEAALEFFPDELSIPRYQVLLDIVRANPTVRGPRYIEPDEFALMMNAIPRHIKRVVYVASHNYFRNRRDMSPEDALPVVKIVLDNLGNYLQSDRRRNPMELTQDEDGWHLVLKNARYVKFVMPIAVPRHEGNALTPLKLKSLRFDVAAPLDPEELIGLFLDELYLLGANKYPDGKFFVLERIRLKRLYHQYPYSDAFFKAHAPTVECIRFPVAADVE